MVATPDRYLLTYAVQGESDPLPTEETTMTTYDDITGKRVTIVPAADTLSSDYRGKTGKVISGASAMRPATGPFVRVQIDGQATPKQMHRAHLIVTPTPGMIEVDPTDLFGQLVTAAAVLGMYDYSEFDSGVAQGTHDTLFVLYQRLTGKTAEEVTVAVAEALEDRAAHSG